MHERPQDSGEITREEHKLIHSTKYEKNPELFSPEAIMEQADKHLIAYTWAMLATAHNSSPEAHDAVEVLEGEKNFWLNLLSGEERDQAIEDASDWLHKFQANEKRLIFPKKVG